MSATDTVTLDRAEFEAILIEIGGLADFADRVYGGHTLESMLWNKLLGLQKQLLCAAGFPTDIESFEEARYELERERERALLAEYVADLLPEAVAP